MQCDDQPRVGSHSSASLDHGMLPGYRNKHPSYTYETHCFGWLAEVHLALPEDEVVNSESRKRILYFLAKLNTNGKSELANLEYHVTSSRTTVQSSRCIGRFTQDHDLSPLGGHCQTCDLLLEKVKQIWTQNKGRKKR